jgi:glycosyltransferase involved in cell wall biosynthesis
MTSAPLVSIVVPTRNSDWTLAACLRSARAQTHSPIELIVVDNNSTDGTHEIAAELADRVLSGGFERSAQRNLGARQAQGRYVLFVDSDMLLAPDVVAACVAAAANAEAVVVPERSVGSGFWTACRALERACYLGDETIESARFFDRETVLRAGGYDEALSAGEDWDLHARVVANGGRVSRAASTIDHDEGRLSLRRLAAKKFSYGRSLSRYAVKHPSLARRQLVLVRPAFVRHRRTLAQRPFLLAGIAVMKLTEFAAGAAGALTAAALPAGTGQAEREAE